MSEFDLERKILNSCEYCDDNSTQCEYFRDSDGRWFQDIETGEWSDYDDGYVHQYNYGVRYCAYCGRRLV